MIGLDTSILVRYVMQDDARQSGLAAKLIDTLTPEAPGFVPLVALIEFIWVLGSAYRLNRAQLAQAVDALLRSREIMVERSELIWKALRLFSASSADFADCLVERAAAEAGCTRTVTFDRNAAKSCGMVLLD